MNRLLILRMGISRLKSLFLLLWLISFVPSVNSFAQYKHKSETEIANLTPAQRVDEYAAEQVHHKYDVLDHQGELIAKYIRLDGLKGLPRMIEIINEYLPNRNPAESDETGVRFDAMWMMLGDLDNVVIRLRASEEGRRAIVTLELAINRMRAAGYGGKDQHEWAQHGRFDLASMSLSDAKGTGAVDDNIRDTLWIKYRIRMSDRELLNFSNFLISRDPTYPSWSEGDLFKDDSRRNRAGNPLQVYVMKEPERFYDAYREFKKAKQRRL